MKNLHALLAVGMIALSASAGFAATTNLLANGGAEDPLVNGEIPFWTEVTGNSWTQRSTDPETHAGAAYFFAGATSFSHLQQVVDVTGFAATIAAGTQAFSFTGYVRSFLQGNPDTSQITVTYMNSVNRVLASFDSGEIADTSGWQQVSNTQFAPTDTTSIVVDLFARRNAETNNDGYFDTLSLTAVAPSAVPVPASLLMMGTALAGFGFGARRLRKKPS